MAGPTALDWVVTSVAVLAVVAVGAAVIVAPTWPRAATTACRVAAACFAGLAVAALLTGAVLAAAGSVADGIDLAAEPPERPTGAFTDLLVDADPDATEAAGTYAPLVLGPLAALLGVLAHAVADPARTTGLRSVAGVVAATVLAGSLVVVLGDTGPLAAAAGVGVALLAAGALGALLADQASLRRERRQPAPVPASSEQASA